jgi:hypothetical protein
VLDSQVLRNSENSSKQYILRCVFRKWECPQQVGDKPPPKLKPCCYRLTTDRESHSQQNEECRLLYHYRPAVSVIAGRGTGFRRLGRWRKAEIELRQVATNFNVFRRSCIRMLKHKPIPHGLNDSKRRYTAPTSSTPSCLASTRSCDFTTGFSLAPVAKVPR